MSLWLANVSPCCQCSKSFTLRRLQAGTAGSCAWRLSCTAAVLCAGVTGPPDCPSEVHLAPDLAAFDFTQLQVQDYQAVLINTGWEVTPHTQQQPQQQLSEQQRQAQQQQQQAEPEHHAGPGPSSLAAAAAASPGVASWGYGSEAHAWHVGSSGSSVVSRLEKLPIPTLCPKGFIMIWANKEHLSGIDCCCSMLASPAVLTDRRAPLQLQRIHRAGPCL